MRKLLIILALLLNVAAGPVIWNGSNSKDLSSGGLKTPKVIIPASGNAVTIAPPSLSGSYTLTLPTDGGTNGYVLTTNGSGTTSWTAGVLTSLNQNNIFIGNSSNATTATNTSLLGSAKATSGSATVTITIATPGVVTLSSHGFATGDKVYLETTGALPTGLSVDTTYYVIGVDTNTFELATSYANALSSTAIDTSGTQSGTHTLYYGGLVVPDASTTNRGLVNGTTQSFSGVKTFSNGIKFSGSTLSTFTDWTIFTPSLAAVSGGTIGSINTDAAVYEQVGNQVNVQYSVVSFTVLTSTVPYLTFTLPFAPTYSFDYPIIAHNGNVIYIGKVELTASSTTARIYAQANETAWAVDSTASHNRFFASFSYRR